jgi:hypothetical protein
MIGGPILNGRRVSISLDIKSAKRFASAPKNFCGSKASRASVCHCILLEKLGEISPLGTAISGCRLGYARLLAPRNDPGYDSNFGNDGPASCLPRSFGTEEKSGTLLWQISDDSGLSLQDSWRQQWPVGY